MTHHTPVSAKRRDLLVGALAISGGISVMWMAGQIRGMPGQPFSPGFFPGIVGGLAALLGMVVVLRAGLGHAPRIQETDAPDEAEPALRLAALWVLGGIAAIAVFFEVVGFLPLLLVWLTGFQRLLGVGWLRSLALSIALTMGVEQAFTRLLGIPLPPGDWRIALGWI
jgi:putative tricarboxylic transport membrane protein